ncbi:ThuA domain-containing protein [Planctomycetota bacterium]
MRKYIVSAIIMSFALIMSIPVYAGFGGGGQRQMDVSEEEAQLIEEAMPTEAPYTPKQERKILVFCVTEGFFHEGIPYFNRALQIMGEKTGAFTADITTDLNDLLSDNLEQYDALCLNNTVSMPVSPETTPEICESIINFIEGGKGIIGIHAATDNFYDWPEAAEMMGGTFDGHPWGAGGVWAVKFDEPDHPLMVPLQGHQGFRIQTEIYRSWPPLYSRDKQLVLMSLDMSDEATSNTAQDERDSDTGITWIKEVGEGRMFYCSLGHGGNITQMTPILEHYLLGIQWALGDIDGVDATPKGTDSN